MATPVMTADRLFQKFAMRCLRNSGVRRSNEEVDEQCDKHFFTCFAIVLCPDEMFLGSGERQTGNGRSEIICGASGL
jgi:hypothetical protein